VLMKSRLECGWLILLIASCADDLI
jgi:hypothetical protein